MFLACSRFIFLLTFLASFLVLSASLYLEYGSGLEPCSLCLVQRFFLTAFCLVNLFACFYASRLKSVWACASLSMVLAVGGVVGALCQVLLQRLEPEQLMFCQPDLACMWEYLSFGNWFLALYRGSEACLRVSWTVFGLSVPELSLLAFTGMCLLSGAQIIRLTFSRPKGRPCDAR